MTFRVADNGAGIAEADRSRVTERFVRLEESRSKPGAGLGLSLVSAVAQLHGGKLRPDRQQAGPCGRPNGARVRLPAVPPEALANRIAALAAHRPRSERALERLR